MYSHILIATDGSELSQKALAEGLEIARVAGAKVTLLTVTEPFPTFDLASRLGLFQDPQQVEQYNARSREIADAILTDAKEAAGRTGLACETLHVDNSAPATAILEAARFRACDLIVLGSHGRRGLERVVLGSQTSEVLLGAKVSVLIVR